MKKKIAIIAFAGIFSFAAFPTGMYAAAPSCDFESDASILASISASAKSTQDKIREELAVRKTMLERIIACARAEVRGVSEDLELLRIQGDPRIASFRTTLISQLAAIDAQYALHETRVKDLGLWGSKEMARAIRETRNKDFARTKEEVATLILWYNQGDLIETAYTRFSFAKETLRILEIEKEAEITPHLDAIAELLAFAADEHGKLRTAFREQRTPENGLARVKSTLEAMEKTYHSFSDLSEAVKTLVPRY